MSHDEHHAFDAEPTQVLSDGEPMTPMWLPILGTVLFVLAAVAWTVTGDETTESAENAAVGSGMPTVLPTAFKPPARPAAPPAAVPRSTGRPRVKRIPRAVGSGAPKPLVPRK